MNKDLTVGKVRNCLWLYTLPLLGSVVFQLLYNLADTVIAGNFISTDALASVGNASEITLIYTCFAFGCNTACSVIASRLIGEKNYTEMKTSISTSFIVFGCLCVLLMAFGFIFTKPLLRGMETLEENFADSYSYLIVYTIGIPFVFFYNVATGVFSAMGDSKTPFVFLAISSTANVFVDILFVKVFSLGVMGLALATVICQGISAILAILFLIRKIKKLPCIEKAPIFSKKLFKSLVLIAIPSILQQGSISIGNIIIQKIINGYGEGYVVAGYIASIKLISIATSIFSAVGNGLSNFVSQNIGADQWERIYPAFAYDIIFLLFLVVPITIIFAFLGKPFILLFMEKDTSVQAVKCGVNMLKMVSPFILLIGLKILSDGILRGSGSIVLFMISTTSNVIARVISAFILSANFGIPILWWAWGIGWTIGFLVSISFLLSNKWKNSKIK